MIAHSRRKLLACLGGVSMLPSMLKSTNAEPVDGVRHIATNTYPWLTFARRSKQAFKLHTDELLANIAATGIAGYEPIIDSSDEFLELDQRLERHGLEMRSIYVNSVLHEAAKVDESSERVISIARQAKRLGVKIVVTNPSPIRWGGTEDKSDAELRLQAKSLDLLGAELRKLGLALAYHNHDAELRQGGREFHHMLTATRAENVKFCLDAHWVYRGCGNSEVAVFDALAHYSDRIVELHLRQSKAGVWAESFSMQGDVDYRRLLDFLESRSIRPHLVLEQAIEESSPNSLNAIDAHRLSHVNLSKTFN